MSREIYEIAKAEILGREEKPCCNYAFLSGAIRGAGELIFTMRGFALTFRHSDEAFIEKIRVTVNKLTGEEFRAEKSYVDMGYKRGVMYNLSVPSEFADLLEKCGIVKNRVELIDNLPSEIFGKKCCKRAFLRGLFAACGALTVPEEISEWTTIKTKAGYGAEFVLNSDMVLKPVMKLISSVAQTDISAIHVRPRRNSVYIKRADAISALLAAMGCDKAVIKLNEIIAERQLKNDLNRANNFDLANIEKTVDAGERQLDIIAEVERKIGFDALSPALRETCIIRRQYPDLNLAELGRKFDPPISKSCINHRLRKLAELAKTE